MTLVRSFSFVALLAAACNAGATVVTNETGTDPDATSEAGRDGAGATEDGGIRDSGVPEEPYDVDPGEPHVQLVGRFDTRVAGKPKCAWPGCRIVARFQGTSVSVRLSEDYQSWMEAAPSEWDATVDGVTQKIVMQAGAHDYVLATSLPPGPHTVELYKRTEPQTGTTQFQGFDFGGGTLLPPPARKARRIEIIGDSQPAAFGVEGVGYPDLDCPGADHGAQWQNFRKSFGARLGEIFDAEVQGTVYSGKGLAQNIWIYDEEKMSVVYERALPMDPTSTWEAGAYVPHVIVIMLGGNDFDVRKPFDNGPATVEAFTDAYRSFLASLRSTYPATPIVFVVSPSVTDKDPQHMIRTWLKQGVTTVTNERIAAGDTLYSLVEPAVATPGELTGCMGHGNPAYHQRVATELAPIIRQKTGWP
jgi:hypothetical protein